MMGRQLVAGAVGQDSEGRWVLAEVLIQEGGRLEVRQDGVTALALSNVEIRTLALGADEAGEPIQPPSARHQGDHQGDE